jgi:hypothetical protein
VERRHAPPAQVARQPARVEDRALDVAGAPGPAWLGPQLQPGGAGSRISARRRSSRPGSISSTRQKSSESPPRRRCGSRRPRRRPTPPRIRSSRPRRAQASGKEYQPCSPPMPSTTRHNSSALAATAAWRTSWYSEPPSRGRWAADRSARRATPPRTNGSRPRRP